MNQANRGGRGTQSTAVWWGPAAVADVHEFLTSDCGLEPGTTVPAASMGLGELAGARQSDYAPYVETRRTRDRKRVDAIKRVEEQRAATARDLELANAKHDRQIERWHSMAEWAKRWEHAARAAKPDGGWVRSIFWVWAKDRETGRLHEIKLDSQQAPVHVSGVHDCGEAWAIVNARMDNGNPSGVWQLTIAHGPRLCEAFAGRPVEEQLPRFRHESVATWAATMTGPEWAFLDSLLGPQITAKAHEEPPLPPRGNA